MECVNEENHFLLLCDTADCHNDTYVVSLYFRPHGYAAAHFPIYTNYILHKLKDTIILNL